MPLPISFTKKRSRTGASCWATTWNVRIRCGLLVESRPGYMIILIAELNDQEELVAVIKPAHLLLIRRQVPHLDGLIAAAGENAAAVGIPAR